MDALRTALLQRRLRDDVDAIRSVDVRDFDADPTGTKDSWLALQRAHEYLQTLGGGQLYFGSGTYVFSKKLTFKPSPGFIERWEGEQYSQGSAGVILQYDGPSLADAAIEWIGTSAWRMAHIAIYGSAPPYSSGALYAFRIWEGGSPQSTEDVQCEHCVFLAGVGADSAAVAIGSAIGYDVAEIRLAHCLLGGGGHTDSALIVLGSGNCKNFTLDHCHLSSVNRSGLRATISLSGSNVLLDPIFSNCGIADIEVPAFTGTTVVKGGDSEGSDRPLYCSGSAGFSWFTAEGWKWTGSCSDDSAAYGGAFAGATNDNALFAPSQNLVLIGCQFNNSRAGGSPSKVIVNANQFNDNQGSLTSIACAYSYSTDFPPFYDSSGNHLINSDNATNGQNHVVSLNDFGASNSGGFGSGLVRFPPYLGSDLQDGSQAIQTDTLVGLAGATLVTRGNNGGFWARFTVSYVLFQTAATLNEVLAAHFKKKTRIRAIVLDTTTAYAGTAGTIVLGAEDGLGSSNNYIAAHDVKTAAVRKGDLPGDYTVTGSGGLMDPAVIAHLGFVPSYTAQKFLFLRMLSGAGNLSGLNAGQTEVYIHFDVVP